MQIKRGNDYNRSGSIREREWFVIGDTFHLTMQLRKTFILGGFIFLLRIQEETTIQSPMALIPTQS